jgi:hypothetical protein
VPLVKIWVPDTEGDRRPILIVAIQLAGGRAVSTGKALFLHQTKTILVVTVQVIDAGRADPAAVSRDGETLDVWVSKQPVVTIARAVNTGRALPTDHRIA